MTITPQPRGVIELDRTPLFQNTSAALASRRGRDPVIDRAQATNAVAEREALIADYGSGPAARSKLRIRGPARARQAARGAISRGRGDRRAGRTGRGVRRPRARARARGSSGGANRNGGIWRLLCSSLPARIVSRCRRRRRVGRALDPSDGRRSDRAPSQRRSRRSRSLICALERATEGLPVRVQIRNQAAAASVGDGFVAVRPGLWHSRETVTRIVLHEIEGPRPASRIGAARGARLVPSGVGQKRRRRRGPSATLGTRSRRARGGRGVANWPGGTWPHARCARVRRSKRS